MNTVKIIENNRGGFSLSFPQEIGNYATREDARRAATLGGYKVEEEQEQVERRTAREWFKLLPDDIETMAVANIVFDRNLDEYADLSVAICLSFSWADSEQGSEFWVNICKAANRGEYDEKGSK